MNCINTQLHKQKVVFVMGATGTGKSRLSIDLAIRFPAEIINSDKMQVYKGLNIVTNKITESERRGVPHHLLGEVDPDSDFTALDFCYHSLSAIERISRSGRIPIIVGGSNSFIETLVEDKSIMFRSKFDCCFIWLDVSLPVLRSFVSKRVDQMIEAGLVDEVRGMFIPGADYTRGIRRAIGVPEMDKFFQAEMETEMDETNKEMLLGAAIEETKDNTYKLICRQLEKIKRLRNELRWAMHRVDATLVFEKCGKEADDLWEELVVQPSMEMVNDFLREKEKSVADETIISTSVDQALGQLQVAN